MPPGATTQSLRGELVDIHLGQDIEFEQLRAVLDAVQSAL